MLVTGIFGGTKVLQQFLSCKKTYECVALFGCSTDTYDAVGKILCRAPHQHITKEAVEEALNAFRGDIMQKPPMYVLSSASTNSLFGTVELTANDIVPCFSYSALHHKGKRFYEYAREGKPLPIEIQARPVTVDSIELLDFTTDHTYDYPREDASEEDKIVGKALQEQKRLDGAEAEQNLDRAVKRAGGGLEVNGEPLAKRRKPKDGETATTTVGDVAAPDGAADNATPETPGEPRPVAVKVRMTVASGFYVRSFVHE